MAQSRRRLLILVPALLLLGVLGSAVFRATRAPVFPPLPSPNGYDDFIRAGAAVPRAVGDFRDLDRAALAELVAANAESLKLLRLGLGCQCRVPTEAAIRDFASVSPTLVNVKRLGQLLAAEGRLAELDDRPADAARSYTEAIALGNDLGRGGFIIHRLVGVAIEGIGMLALAKLGPKLDAAQTRPIVAELEKINSSQVTWDEVLVSERAFARREYRKVSVFSWPSALWQAHKSSVSARVLHTVAVARVRLLAAELALRCYRSDRGQPAQSLGDLVPNYLQSLPQDPFTEKPLVYRPQGTNWLLYSVGPDGVDDGGKPSQRGANKGDLFFDSAW